MLSIQPVKLTNSYSFKGYEVPYEEDYAYSKSSYENDKSKLEEQLRELNDVIGNTTVPKPIRALGKIASVGIAAGLGYVSMKFGAQGITKMIKKGYNYSKDLMNKPAVKETLNKFSEVKDNSTKYAKTKLNEFAANASENSFIKNTTGKLNTFFETIKNSDFAKQIKNIADRLSNSKFAEFCKELTTRIKTAFNNITGETVEKGVVNLFAVSGGVTGGISALQETMGKES